MSYVDGFVVPVPKDRLEDYRKMAEAASIVWKEHGALDYKECVLEDLTGNDFTMTFPRAVQSNDNETIVFAYIVYKDRAHRDEVNKKVMADPRLGEGCNPDNMPFDCKRMAYGGFKTIVSA